MLPKNPNKYLIKSHGSGLKDEINGILVIAKMEIGEYAEVTGTVEQLPVREETLGLKIGDEIAHHYHVTSSEQVTGKDTEEVFSADEPDMFEGKIIRKWSNKIGHVLNVIYLHNDKWSCWMNDRSNVIHDYQDKLNEREMEDWLGKQKFAETYYVKRTNTFSWKGEDYFFCRPDQVYCVKREGKITAMPNFLLCQIPEKRANVQSDGQIVMLEQEQKGWVWLDVLVSNTEYRQIYIKRNLCPEYTFWGEKYLVAPQQFMAAYRTHEQYVDELSKKFAV